MWIRSQDRESLVKVNTLRMYYLNNQGWGIFTNNYVPPNDRMALGYYSTKEQALNVLDEIHFYLNKGYTETTINTQEQYIMKQSYFNVYQMPQDVGGKNE